MSIHVTCGSCGEEFSLKDTAAGKRFTCKVCGASIRVPAADAETEDDGDDEEEVVDEAPARPATRSKSGKKAAVASRCLLPAIFLYVLGALSFLNHASGIALNAMGVSTNPFEQFQQQPVNEPPEVAKARKAGVLVGTIFFAAIFLALDCLVLYGAYCLQTLRNHGMAMTGAIISCIPVCSPCLILGIPFGIWALVVLNDKDVKSAFS